jgi:hypothetical protein
MVKMKLLDQQGMPLTPLPQLFHMNFWLHIGNNLRQNKDGFLEPVITLFI